MMFANSYRWLYKNVWIYKTHNATDFTLTDISDLKNNKEFFI